MTTRLETRKKQEELAQKKQADLLTKPVDTITVTNDLSGGVSPSLLDTAAETFKTYLPSIVGSMGEPGKLLRDVVTGDIQPVDQSKEYAITTPPALRSETITYSPSFLGIRSAQNIEYKVDYAKLGRIQGMSITDVLPKNEDGSSSDAAKNTLTDAIGFTDKDGRVVTFEKGSDFEKRVMIADRGAATSLIIPFGGGQKNVPLNFEQLISNQINIPIVQEPDEVFAYAGPDAESPVFNIPFTKATKDGKALTGIQIRKLQREGKDVASFYRKNNYKHIVDLGTDPELSKALFARELNKNLIAQGITDARTRLGIINFEKNLGQLVGVGFGDFNKIGYRGLDNIKFVLEAGGYLLAEAGGAIAEMLSTNPENINWNDSEERDQFWNKFLPSSARIIQRNFAGNNINITLKQAEYLARRYSGVGTRLIGVAPDIAIPSGIIKMIMKRGGRKELERYRHFRNEKINERGLSKKKITKELEDEILGEFDRTRFETIFGLTSKDIIAKPLTERIIYTPLAKTVIPLRRIIGSNNLRYGMQLDDALKIKTDPTGKAIAASPEIAPLLKSREAIKNQINSLEQRRNLILKRNKQAPVADIDRKIKDLMLDEEKVTSDMMKLAAQSNVPKFIREIDKVDRAMIVGAAFGGQFGQAGNADPTVFELTGMLTGMLYGTRANFSELQKYAKFGGKFVTVEGRTGVILAEDFAKLLNTFSPELRSSILSRAEKIGQLQDVLLSKNINPKVLELTINQIANLQVLHLAEEGFRHMLNPKALKNGDIVKSLQENFAAQQKLVGELRKTMLELGGPDTGVDASQNFFKIVEQAAKYAEDNAKQLQSDLDVIQRVGKKYFLGLVKGNPNKNFNIPEGKENAAEVDKLDTAMTNLSKQGIEKINVDDIKAADNQRLKNRKEILTTIEDQSINNTLKFKTIDQAGEDVEKVVDTKKLQPKIKGTDEPKFKQITITKTKGTPINDGISNPSDLFGLLIESKHKDELTKFEIKYNRIGPGATLIDNATNETFKASQVSADGGVLLEEMFKIMKIKGGEAGDEAGSFLIDKLARTNIGAGDQNKIFNVISNAADDFFKLEAEQTGKSLKQYKIDMLNKMEKDKDFQSIQGVSDDIQMLDYVLTKLRNAEAHFNIVPFGLNDLQSLRSAFGMLANNASNALVRGKFDKLDGITNTMYLNGVSARKPDGSIVPVSNLSVNIDGEVKPVLKYLTDVDTEYSRFKRQFYDKDNYVGKIMGWNTKGGRQHVEPQLNFEIGLDTKIPTKEWLNFDEVLKNTKIADDMMQALGDYLQVGQNRAGYVLRLKDAQGKINPEVLAFKSVLENAYAAWLKSKQGVLDPVDIIEQSRKLENTFSIFDETAQTADKKVTVFDWRKVVEDTNGFDETNFKRDLIKKTNEANESAVEEILVEKKTEIGNLILNVKNVASILQRYTARNLNADTLMDALLGGGTFRLNEIKRILKATGKGPTGKTLTDKEIDEVMFHVFAESMDNTIYRRTGNHALDVENGSIFPEFDMDVEAMKRITGYLNANSARAKAFREVVGEDRANFYDAAIEFVETAKGNRPSGIALRGVPQAFALESYISRFYSIQRGVISARYVGTEAILQQYRLSGAKAFRAMLTNPKAGQAFLDMIKSGKQIDSKVDKNMFRAFLVNLAFTRNFNEEITRENKENAFSTKIIFNTLARLKGKDVDVTKYREFLIPPTEENINENVQ